MENCLFCSINPDRIIAEDELAYAIRDEFPVTKDHTLIIPKRHVEDYFHLTPEELLSCDSLLIDMEEKIRMNDSSVKGFNIGINIGEVAGQTIYHCHIHLIPRREGDTENPCGGVRNIISGN